MSEYRIKTLVAYLNMITIDFKKVKIELEYIKLNIESKDYEKLINGNYLSKQSNKDYIETEITGYKGWCIMSLIDYHHSVSNRISDEDYPNFKAIL